MHKRGRFTPATPRPSLQLQRTFRSLSHAHTHTRASAEPRPDDCGGRYVPESSITGGSLQPNLVCPNVQGSLPASQAEVGQAGWGAYRPRRGLLLHLEGYQSHGTATIRTRLRISKGRACRGFRRGRIPRFSSLPCFKTRNSWREWRGTASGPLQEAGLLAQVAGGLTPPWGSRESYATCWKLEVKRASVAHRWFQPGKVPAGFTLPPFENSCFPQLHPQVFPI